MSEEKILRTFTTRTPDKPGAFMLACKVIMDHDGNIVRVSFNKGVNLFIEVYATREQLNAIDKELSEISYVDYMPKEPMILVMDVRIKDVPGALYPVLKVIDKYDVNISYLNSKAENRDYQNFNIGMEVERPEISKKILDEVATIYPLDVVSYNGNYHDLDITVEYIRLANSIQRLFSQSDDVVKMFIEESKQITEVMKEHGQEPKEVFDSIKQLANFIAFHRDLNFKPRLTEIALTPETTLHVIEPPCGSNTYILRNNDSLLFIDSGLGIFADEMITELREMFPCFFSMEKMMIATHADVDHNGLLSIIEGAKILMTKKTKDILIGHKGDDGIKNVFADCFGRLSRIVNDYEEPNIDSISILGKDVPESHDDLLLIDKFRFGDIEFEVYEGNGGHMKGETILYSREPKILFTGDLYSNLDDLSPERAEFETVAPFLLKNSDSNPELLNSICSKIKDIIDKEGKKGTIVCGGHGAVKRL